MVFTHIFKKLHSLKNYLQTRYFANFKYKDMSNYVDIFIIL